MEILRSHADTRSETYRENRAGFLEQIALLTEQLEQVRAGGGEKYVKRHEKRGKLFVRERFGAREDRSCLLRFHTQTAGSTLQSRQIDVNVVRTAMQALAAVLGGTQSLHTNGRDEDLTAGIAAEHRPVLNEHGGGAVACRSNGSCAAGQSAPNNHDVVRPQLADLPAHAAEFLAQLGDGGFLGRWSPIQVRGQDHRIATAVVATQVV